MSEDKTFGYLPKVIELLTRVEEEQYDNLMKAADLMAKAIREDKLINVYGGGGHTTLPVGEMFFRAGGLSNINPIVENGLTVFNQALKYLQLERCVNYGRSILKYFNLQRDDVLIIFHNIGINAATIDAALEAKEAGVKVIAVASSYWQKEIPEDSFIRHPSKKNLFDLADVCIDDYNPVGDTVVKVPGFDIPMGPISNIVHFYIAHRLEIEAARKCVEMGIEPPVWSSANVEGGDEYNQKNIDRYFTRVKLL